MIIIIIEQRLFARTAPLRPPNAVENLAQTEGGGGEAFMVRVIGFCGVTYVFQGLEFRELRVVI